MSKKMEIIWQETLGVFLLGTSPRVCEFPRVAITKCHKLETYSWTLSESRVQNQGVHSTTLSLRSLGRIWTHLSQLLVAPQAFPSLWLHHSISASVFM